MSQLPKVSDCDVLPWTEIANQIQQQVLAQVQQQKPELLRDEFDKQFVSLRPMGPVQGLFQKFEELWFSSIDNKEKIAQACAKTPDQITPSCLEVPPYCILYLKLKRPSVIKKPAAGKTLVIIAAGPLNRDNGMFGVGTPPATPDLNSGQDILVSGDTPQYYEQSAAGGLGIVLRVNYKCEGTQQQKSKEEDQQDKDGVDAP